MATVQTAYATPTTLTITLTSLASSATAGRESTAVDNGTTLYLDALVQVKTKLAAGTPANDKAIYVYAYGSVDGTTFPDTVTGVNAAITLNDPTQLRLIGVINATTSAQVCLSEPMSVAQAFGGILPETWGIVVRNYSGVALSSTAGDHEVDWVGVTQTVT